MILIVTFIFYDEYSKLLLFHSNMIVSCCYKTPAAVLFYNNNATFKFVHVTMAG